MINSLTTFYLCINVQDALLSIVLGVISSFIFLFILLYTMRPNIKISKSICYLKMKPQNHYWYVFKVVNRSLFSTYDINIRLEKMEPVMVNNGKKINYRIVEIETSSNYLNHLPRLKFAKGIGDHAYLIRTKENIRKDVKDQNTTVKLTITSKHGLTNLTRVVHQEFVNIECIKKDKEFKFGRHLTTI